MSGDRQQGGCRCGEVRFAAAGRPILTMACHCRGCQRMTGGAYSLSSLYPGQAFELSAGATVLGGLKGGTKHHFCASCLSWIYTVPEGFDAFVNIRSTMFDDSTAHLPYVDMNRAEALPGVETGAVERFETEPDEATFATLLENYAAWAAEGEER